MSIIHMQVANIFDDVGGKNFERKILKLNTKQHYNLCHTQDHLHSSYISDQAGIDAARLGNK